MKIYYKDTAMEGAIIKAFLICSAACELISLFFLGFDKAFLLGAGAASLTFSFNYILLCTFVTKITRDSGKTDKIYLSILIEAVRIALFTLSVFLCVRSGMRSVAAYLAIAVIFILIVAVSVWREAKK